MGLLPTKFGRRAAAAAGSTAPSNPPGIYMNVLRFSTGFFDLSTIVAFAAAGLHLRRPGTRYAWVVGDGSCEVGVTQTQTQTQTQTHTHTKLKGNRMGVHSHIHTQTYGGQMRSRGVESSCTQKDHTHRPTHSAPTIR